MFIHYEYLKKIYVKNMAAMVIHVSAHVSPRIVNVFLKPFTRIQFQNVHLINI